MVCLSAIKPLKKFLIHSLLLITYYLLPPTYLTGCTNLFYISSISTGEENISGYKSSLVIDGFKNPQDLCVSDKGYIYVTDTGNQEIKKFNRDGELIMTIKSEHEWLTGITCSKRYLYVIDRNTNTVNRYTKDGEFLNKVYSVQKGRQEPSQLNDIAVTPDNKTIYVVEGDRAITISSGYLYLVSPSRIQKFRLPDLEQVLTFGSFGTEEGEFRCPQGIAVDKSGNIFVADTMNNRIQKFDKNGVFITCFNGLHHPMGISVNKTGEVWVVEHGGDRIQKLRPLVNVVFPKVETINYEWIYNRARQFQTIGKYHQAIAFYERCIDMGRDSSLAPKACFLIGECYRSLNDFESALISYDKVINNYSKSAYVPCSLLKKGEMAYKLKLLEVAIKSYKQLIDNYPKTYQAEIAKKRLIILKSQ
ncbi:MAG: tetratricopeptide repeat protein [bacterium]|nr:tetratricopeptide repeat protein [bacterium]